MSENSRAEQRLLEEVRQLRSELRQLTIRVDHQGDQIADLHRAFETAAFGEHPASEASASVEHPSRVSEVGTSTGEAEPSLHDQSTYDRPDGVTPYPWSVREDVAREIGCFLRRALVGEHRGTSGRN